MTTETSATVDGIQSYNHDTCEECEAWEVRRVRFEIEPETTNVTASLNFGLAATFGYGSTKKEALEELKKHALEYQCEVADTVDWLMKQNEPL